MALLILKFMFNALIQFFRQYIEVWVIQEEHLFKGGDFVSRFADQIYDSIV